MQGAARKATRHQQGRPLGSHVRRWGASGPSHPESTRGRHSTHLPTHPPHTGHPGGCRSRENGPSALVPPGGPGSAAVDNARGFGTLINLGGASFQKGPASGCRTATYPMVSSPDSGSPRPAPHGQLPCMVSPLQPAHHGQLPRPAHPVSAHTVIPPRPVYYGQSPTVRAPTSSLPQPAYPHQHTHRASTAVGSRTYCSSTGSHPSPVSRPHGETLTDRQGDLPGAPWAPAPGQWELPLGEARNF